MFVSYADLDTFSFSSTDALILREGLVVFGNILRKNSPPRLNNSISGYSQVIEGAMWISGIYENVRSFLDSVSKHNLWVAHKRYLTRDTRPTVMIDRKINPLYIKWSYDQVRSVMYVAKDIAYTRMRITRDALESKMRLFGISSIRERMGRCRCGSIHAPRQVIYDDWDELMLGPRTVYETPRYTRNYGIMDYNSLYQPRFEYRASHMTFRSLPVISMPFRDISINIDLTPLNLPRSIDPRSVPESIPRSISEPITSEMLDAHHRTQEERRTQMRQTREDHNARRRQMREEKDENYYIIEGKELEFPTLDEIKESSQTHRERETQMREDRNAQEWRPSGYTWQSDFPYRSDYTPIRQAPAISFRRLSILMFNPRPARMTLSQTLDIINWGNLNVVRQLDLMRAQNRENNLIKRKALRCKQQRKHIKIQSRKLRVSKYSHHNNNRPSVHRRGNNQRLR